MTRARRRALRSSELAYEAGALAALRDTIDGTSTLPPPVMRERPRGQSARIAAHLAEPDAGCAWRAGYGRQLALIRQAMAERPIPAPADSAVREVA